MYFEGGNADATTISNRSTPAGSLLVLLERKNSHLNKKCLINQSPHDDVSISPIPWAICGLAPASHFPTHYKAGVTVHERRCLDVKPAEKYPSHFSFPIRNCFSSCFLVLPLSRSPSPLPSFLSRIPEPWTKTYLSYFKSLRFLLHLVFKRVFIILST